jgi:hypothetical protein
VKLEQHDAQYRQQVVAEPSPAVAPLQPVQFFASEQGLHPLEEAEELILTLARSAEKAGRKVFMGEQQGLKEWGVSCRMYHIKELLLFVFLS